MLEIAPGIVVDERALEFHFIRAPGPGGQKVNKTASAVQLRFDAARDGGLPDEVRRRLLTLAGRRVNEQGVIVITATRHRTQRHNRADALERLATLLRAAAQRPKTRKTSRPSAAAKRRRLDDKRRQSERKQRRKPVGAHEG